MRERERKRERERERGREREGGREGERESMCVCAGNAIAIQIIFSYCILYSVYMYTQLRATPSDVRTFKYAFTAC